MKISKSKRQLAQLLIEAGVTKYPEGANWAAQDKSCRVFFYSARPECNSVEWVNIHVSGELDPKPSVKIPNWHQTALSRDEFDHIVAAETVVSDESGSDGWIKWDGGDSPVGDDVTVDVKTRDGEIESDKACYWNWSHEKVSCISERQIIAYRLHNAEQSEAPTDGESPEQREKLARIYAPTLDQLLQDWRNADDYAQRKQAEADEAAAMRDERWQAVQARAGEMGVAVGRCESVEVEQELVVTSWKDVRRGDYVWIGDSELSHNHNCPSGEYEVMEVDTRDSSQPFRVKWGARVAWPHIGHRGWHFIRRP